MARVVRVAAAQMGATQRADARPGVLARMLALLDAAAAQGAHLCVFPELAFTTFFPRWLLSPAELDAFCDPPMPHPGVAALFDRACAHGVALHVGYAERDGVRRYNAAVLTSGDGRVLGRYRKVHLPGTTEPRPGDGPQQLEKRYFTPGDLGFPTFRGPAALGGGVLGMLICNDRRWPEAWRMLGLGGVELVCVGYNSAAHDPYGSNEEDPGLRTFHAHLVVQANAYMNATWAVAVAKAGTEDGAGLIGGSCIAGPDGRIVAQARTLDDELVVADCDLDACRHGKSRMFDFAAHRRPDAYGAIVARAGAVPPP